MMELWILIAVAFVGLLFINLYLIQLSHQIGGISEQILQLHVQIINTLNADRKLTNDKSGGKIELIERAVTELRDHLVPPKHGTIRAEVENLKKEARSLGIDI